MDRGSEGSAAPQVSEGGLGFPDSLMLCRRDPKAGATTHADVAGPGLLGGLVFHAIAVSSDDDRLPVMHQPVDHGGGQGVVHVEDRAPVPEGLVRRDDDRAAFIPGGDDLEQQVRTAFVDG